MYGIEQVKEIVGKAISEKDIFLVDLKITKSNQIMVYVDSNKGVAIDECVEISRFIESCLDRDTEDFELEVSSAGIGYPFMVEEQYLKNIGKEVELLLKTGEKLTGVLKSYAKTTIELEHSKMIKQEGKKRKQLVTRVDSFKINNIKSIKVILSF